MTWQPATLWNYLKDKTDGEYKWKKEQHDFANCYVCYYGEKEIGFMLACCKTKAVAANSMMDAASERANAFFGLKINKADPIKSGNKSINSRYIANWRSDYGRIVLFKLTNKMTTMAATIQNK